MRDISRIDPLLAKLGEVWIQNPDLTQFGQFIINLFHNLGKAPWNVEEDEWIVFLRSYLKEG